MAAVTHAPGLPTQRFPVNVDSLSTLPDPRTPKDSVTPMASGSTTPQYPDHNTEVANLSNKLISAINHQTRLDDALSATRDELEAAEHKVKRLEQDKAGYADQIHNGELLWKRDVQDVFDQRQTAEADRQHMEQELENLSQSLFEEANQVWLEHFLHLLKLTANQMVAAARKETEASEQRNEQLRMQVRDTEALLASQQEQLAELKAMMEHMNSQDDRDGVNSAGPSSPAMQSHSDLRHTLEALQSKSGETPDGLVPAPPTSFNTMLSPVLRTDLPSFEDFRALAEISRRSLSASRAGSGAFAAGSMPGAMPGGIPPSNSSMPGSLSGTATPLGGAGSPLMSPAIVPLKETRFYKRALVEDIEPTLRLDTAPGLSWLVRRSVVSSIVEGSLVVEPMPSITKMGLYPCSLCGENRKDQGALRTYRFRTSESDSASRYPLCGYCVNRLRSTCDYIGFLRMIKDGHRKTDTTESEKAAWEESVRLRERMFWARIGGGVVPNFARRGSDRGSTEGSKPTTPYSAPAQINNGIVAPAKNPEVPAQQSSDLSGIDSRLAHFASEKGHSRSESEGSNKSFTQKVSISKETTEGDGSRTAPFASPLRFRTAAYDQSPESKSKTDGSNEISPVSPTSKTTHEGLQITIPAGYEQ